MQRENIEISTGHWNRFTTNGEIAIQSTGPDDIDLLLLTERTIIFFKKYKWIFLLATVCGFAFGYCFYRSLPKTYTSRLIVHSYILTNQEEIQIIDTWNRLLASHEYASLAALFNCKETILHSLKQIKGDEIQKVFSPTNPNGFIIDIITTDTSTLADLQPAILRGLENNDYASQKVSLRKANLNELTSQIIPEIRSLDSTKRELEKIIHGDKKISSSIVIDISTINRQLIEMKEKLTGYNDGLHFASAVQLLQGFSQLKQPTGPKLFVWLFLGLVFSLSIAFVYAFINSINQKLIKKSVGNAKN